MHTGFRFFNSIDIESPSQYQKLLEGLNRKHKFIYVEAGAHHDVLGEAKRWAYASIYQIRFSDEYGNVIILDPQGRRLSAQFTQGNLFAKLPNDYSSYTVTVTDDGIVTEADRRTIARWASAEHVKIVDANGVSVRLA